MKKVKTFNVFVFAVALLVVPLFCRAAEDASSLRPFDGIFNFAWVGDIKQKNLDVGTSDFLIVFRSNTRPITRAHLPDIGIVSKKPMGAQPGYSVVINRNHDLVIVLNDDARERLGKDNYRLTCGKFFKPDTWSDVAVAYQGSKRRVLVYRDGRKVREFPNIKLENLDNDSPFTVGVGNFHQHVRFKGNIAYAGVFTFPKGLPAKADELVAQVAAGDGKIPAGLARADGVRYSFWKLARDEKGVRDLGNNGNFLYYMPENEDLRFAEMNTPVSAKNPRTIYVDVKGKNATDEGEGTAEKPFRSIHRAANFARAGDTVIVKKGVYREQVSVSGGRLGAPIKIIGEKGAVISAADVLKGWKKTKQAGVYVLRGWNGTYFGPGDPKQTDARRKPNSLVFFNGYPLDWVDYVEDLIPGSYTLWPRERHKPKDIYIFPVPGENVAEATIEINTRRGVGLVDYIVFEGFTVTKASVNVNGRGCVIKNCTVEWGRGGIGIGGADHKIIGNRVLWSGNSGMGGGGASGCLIEGNYTAYANWRIFNPGWHGGGAKIIPSNIDNVVRKNEYEYNWGCGFWYDAYNSGNVVEYNFIHDNAGLGLFDEISWGNTIRYNVVFNNWCTRQNRSGGSGLVIGETSDDLVYRNIVFNCERGHGIMLRGYASRRGMGSAQKVIDYSVKYPHHYVRAARHRKWLDKYVKYYKEKVIYMVGVKVLENISFNNHLDQLWTMRDYRVRSDPRNKYYSFDSDRNIFFYRDRSKIVRTGMQKVLSLEKWREVSGKDANSRIIDPFKETGKLPEWARKLFDFKKYASLRTAEEIADMNVEISDCVGSMIFKSRISRAANYRRLKVKDMTLRAFMLDLEGKRALALWRTKGAGNVRVKVAADKVTLEDRWLRRKELNAPDEKVVVFVGRDPVYLIGVGKKAVVDPTYKSTLYGASREMLVYRAPKVKLDGDLSEWKRIVRRGALADVSSGRNYVPGGPRKWGGPKDAGAKVFAGWNASGLYFAFDVTDDSVLTGKDKVELFLDGREVWRHFFVEYQHPGVFHIALAPEAGGKLRISFPPLVKKNRYHRKKPAVGVKGACKVGKRGYTAEVFVPWNKKNFPTAALAKDTIFRVGLLVTDVDAGKVGEVTLKWYAYKDSHSDTTGWLPVATK